MAARDDRLDPQDPAVEVRSTAGADDADPGQPPPLVGPGHSGDIADGTGGAPTGRAGSGDHDAAQEARIALALAARKELARELRRAQRRGRMLLFVGGTVVVLFLAAAVAGTVLAGRGVQKTPGYALHGYLSAWGDGDEEGMNARLCAQQLDSHGGVDLRVLGELEGFDITRTVDVTKGRHARVFADLEVGSGKLTGSFDLVRESDSWRVCTAPGLPSLGQLVLGDEGK